MLNLHTHSRRIGYASSILTPRGFERNGDSFFRAGTCELIRIEPSDIIIDGTPDFIRDSSIRIPFCSLDFGTRIRGAADLICP